MTKKKVAKNPLIGDGSNSVWTKACSQESTWSPTLEKNYQITSIEMTELKRQTNLIKTNSIRLAAIISIIEEDNTDDTTHNPCVPGAGRSCNPF